MTVRHLFKLTIFLFILSCSSGTEKKEEAISAEEEQEIVTSISKELDEAGADLENATKEALNEIDSILQDIEN